MKLKHDVSIIGIQPQIALAAIVVDSVYRSSSDELTITSATEGKHMVGSLHYKGLAIDCRLPKAHVATIMALLKDALGPQFDVVLETDHIHVEFDPKVFST